MTFIDFMAAIAAAFPVGDVLISLAVIFVASATLALAVVGGNVALNQIKRARKT